MFSPLVRQCAGALILILASILASAVLAADRAATAQFVFGNVERISGGVSRPLERGAGIEVGDTILTSANGQVHLSFTDGGFVSLTPRSEFRVNAYRYDNHSDGNETLSLSLLKGGLRTISGAIGKSTQSAYEMITRVATIGIRGTEYTIQYNDGISGTVAGGRIAVCNAAGCLEIAQGQSYFVKDSNTKPVLTAKAADLPPRQPSGTEAVELLTSERDRQADPDVTTWAPALQRPLAAADLPGGSYGSNPDNYAPSDTGNATSQRGIGFQLIGITAPGVDGPMANVVSDFVNDNQPVGNGWGRGGNPSKGPK